MSTNDPLLGSVAGGPETDLAQAMVKGIERLANQFFSGMPGPVENAIVSPASPSAGVDVPDVLALPHFGPNALQVGAGGASSAATLPPVPGLLHRTPVAAAPPPKEGDLRVIPTLLSENLGFPSSVALASPPPADGATPYYLELAGLPTPTSTFPASPTLPGAPSFSGVPSVAGYPSVPSSPSPQGSADGFTALPVGAPEEIPGAPRPPASTAPTPLPLSGSPSLPGYPSLSDDSSLPGSLSTPGFTDGIAALPAGVPSSLPADLPASTPVVSSPLPGAPSLPELPSLPGSPSLPGYSSLNGFQEGLPDELAGFLPVGASVNIPATAPGPAPVGGPSGLSTAIPSAPTGIAGVPTLASGAPPGIPATSTSIPGGVAGLPAAPVGDLSYVTRTTAPDASPLASAPAASTPTSASYEFRPEVIPDLERTRGIFDANAVKRDFPILRERIHGRPLVWLDNAATTQKPQSVIDRIAYYYEHENSNVHRGAHTLAARATDAYEAARDKVRRFLNAPSAKQIVFVRGATEAINLVAKSWGRRNVGPGDEIVLTWLEHHANIVPWQQLASEKGARLRVVPVSDRGEVILEEYEKLLGPKTRVVSFPHVSNALGTIVPAREMVAMAHRHGARVLVDGAQSVPHMPVDVQELDCDFCVFSGHKLFAPTGIGVLYGKADALDGMPPWQGGGNMIADVTFEKTTYQPPPGRFEAGTGSIADAVGLGAAIDYLSALGVENVSRYEHDLRLYAEERLVRVRGLRIIGTAPEKAGVISFVLDGVRTEDVGGALDQEGIAVRSGHHCAQPILRRFGLESTVRASLAPYNTCEDVDALVAALLRIQAGRSGASY
jgi:cysteine desulfurase/selenocysteine lyase